MSVFMSASIIRRLMSTASFNEIAIGVVLGETYEVSRLLGEGGMGAVWEARHLRLPGKRFAIKVLHTSASSDREAYARFRREAEIASRIGHPNIIEVLDWNTLPSGTPYLVLEFLDGEDLAQRLAAGALPIEQALSITRQIGAALKAAHAAEVVHRDMKPGNVFLVPRESGGEILDHVKVLDFGISKIRNSQTVQTQDAVLLGTPQYMAPEQALGKNNEIDCRTDVFALGAIVYEMLAGRAAFQGATLAEVVFKVVYEPTPPLITVVPSVTPEVSAAVERAMAKAPDERFADVGAFITALTGRSLATTDRRAVRGSNVVDAVASTADRTAVDPAASHLRGEVQAPAQSGSMKWLPALIIAIVVGAGGTYGVVQFLGKSPGGTVPGVKAVEPATTTSAARTTAPTTNPMAVAKKDPPTVNPTDNPTGTKVTSQGPKPDKPEKSGGDKPEKPASEPPEVKAKLDEAEGLLRSHDYASARLTAERTMMIQKTSRAYSIMTRAFCLTNDVGNARAYLQHVKGSDRAKVFKACRTGSTPLD